MMYMKERGLMFLMGLHPKATKKSPISYLNQFPNLFDRNLIYCIQSYIGDSQFNFEHRHDEMLQEQDANSNTDIEMDLSTDQCTKRSELMEG